MARLGLRHAERRPVAVSLTPLPLEADSRAFRVACRLAEAGFRSIVVEGRASRQRFWSDKIEVRSCGAYARDRFGTAPRGGALRRGRYGRGGELALYAAFRWHDFWCHCARPFALIPPADLYYLHSFELYRAIAARRAPIVYDAHDFYRGIEPPERQPVFDRERIRPFRERLERRLAAAAAALVTVSDSIATMMEATFGRRPTVIRNCHDARLDRAIDPDLRARLGLSAADRLCVAVGNCKRGMAVDVAVAALSRLPCHFHLAFVGRFYDADRDRLRDHPAADRLHFGHCVQPDEVVPFIRTADLGLVLYEPYSANYRAALPNGFFQIVAAGLPLIRAPLPEIEAAIAGRRIGICLDRLDPPHLAAAILDGAASAPELRAASAAVGRELRWEQEAIRLDSVLKTVLPERAGAAATELHPL
jgi:glycosyltransferase involved in cell wall biosynthesis